MFPQKVFVVNAKLTFKYTIYKNKKDYNVIWST